jgi:hypothetical protein
VLLGYLDPLEKWSQLPTEYNPILKGQQWDPAWLLLQELQKVKCPKARPNKEKNTRSLKIQKQLSQISVDTT